MYCEKCGSKIPDGSLFCTSCGAKLSRTGGTKAATPSDARAELAKANAAAMNVVDSANEEAARLAKEFSESVTASENTVVQDITANPETAEAPEIIEDAAGTLPVLVRENESDTKDGDREESVPVIGEEAGLQESEASENLPITTDNNTEMPIQVVDPDKKNELVPDKGTEREYQRKSSGEIKEGKSIPAGLIIVSSLGLVVLVVALVFILSGSARDGIKRAFMSDENYFKSVEKGAIMDILDEVSEAYEDNFVGLFDFMKSKYALTVDVDVKDEAEDFLESIYKKNRDLDLSWIKQANAEASFQMNSKMLEINGEASVNKKDLADFDFIANMTDHKFFAAIPILSKEYAEIDYSDKVLDPDTAPKSSANMLTKLIDNEDFQKALPTSKEIDRIASRYLDIILDKMERIKFYEDQKLEAGDVKGKYLMITAELSEDLQPEIYDAILKELSKDDEVLAIINRVEKTGVFGDQVSADAFLDWIEKEQDAVYKRNYPYRTLSIWVDDSGKVVGQQLLTDDGTGYTYKYVINGDNFGFEMYETVKNSAREHVKASGTVSGLSVSGNVKYYQRGREMFSLDFLDIDVLDLMRGNPTGALVLDLYDMTHDTQFRGMKLNAEFSLSLKKSNIKLVFSENGKNIIEADVVMKKSSSSKIKEPSKVLDIGKNNSIVTWVKNFDWDTVLKNADKANMPSRYYRQLEKWSESDLNSEINEISNYVDRVSNQMLSGNDLYYSFD